MTSFHFLHYTYRFEIKFVCYGLQIFSSPNDISREIKGVFSSNDVYLAKEEILSTCVVKYQRRVPTLSETYLCPFLRLPLLCMHHLYVLLFSPWDYMRAGPGSLCTGEPCAPVSVHITQPNVWRMNLGLFHVSWKLLFLLSFDFQYGRYSWMLRRLELFPSSMLP